MLQLMVLLSEESKVLFMKAVVFVDVQKDFVKGGKLAFGYPAEDNLQKVVDFAKQCVNAYCNDPTTLVKIYATRDTHEKTAYEDVGTIINFDTCGRVDDTEQINGDPVSGYLATLEGQKLPVEHCVEGTDGWQIVDPLMEVLLGKATFVNKPTFGSYDLADIIAEDVEGTLDEIVICGYDLSICVLANAVLLRAKYPNTKIVVRADLCGDVDEESYKAALKVLQMQQIEIESH